MFFSLGPSLLFFKKIFGGSLQTYFYSIVSAKPLMGSILFF